MRTSLLGLAAAAMAATAEAALPHILFMLVDDWGHADVGFHRPAGFNVREGNSFFRKQRSCAR
jgi:hypothetical protein